jgi:hypothetical protein
MLGWKCGSSSRACLASGKPWVQRSVQQKTKHVYHITQQSHSWASTQKLENKLMVKQNEVHPYYERKFIKAHKINWDKF